MQITNRNDERDMSNLRATMLLASPPPSPLNLHRRLYRSAQKVTVTYLISSLGIILALDLGLRLLFPHLEKVRPVISGSALVFATLSACMLFTAMRQQAKRILPHFKCLNELQALYREQLHELPCPVWIYESQTMQSIDINASALEFFRCTRDEFLSKNIHGIWPDNPQGRICLQEMLQKVQSQPGCAQAHGRAPIHHEIRYLEMRSAKIMFCGRDARLIIIIDRSREYQAECLRIDALAKLDQIQRIASLGFWQLDSVTGYGEFSPEIYHVLGREFPSQDRRHRLEEILTPADLATQTRIAHLIGDLSSGNYVQVDVLLPIIAGDASQRMIHLRAESHASSQGGVVEIHGTIQDVTEREQSRELLREREEQFRELVRVFPDGVMILADECVIYANPACVTQFGYEGEALLGEPLHGLVAAEDLHAVRELLSHLGRPDAVARSMQRRDGSTFYASLTVGKATYGGRRCRLVVIRDLSEPERIRDALAISNAELQAMAKRLFSIQEDERRSISRDLHDDIGQAITAIKLSAHAALEEDDWRRRQEDIQGIMQLADITITKLRNLSMLLRPPQLDALGLEAALRWQASMLFRSSQVHLTLQIAPLSERPGCEIEQACFRIAQESLTNALRHASAGMVELTLTPRDAMGFCLKVLDDGDGFCLDGPRGLGLIMMRERAQTVGGALTIASAPGAGTCVDLYLPYRSQNETSQRQQPLT